MKHLTAKEGNDLEMFAEEQEIDSVGTSDFFDLCEQLFGKQRADQLDLETAYDAWVSQG